MARKPPCAEVATLTVIASARESRWSSQIAPTASSALATTANWIEPSKRRAGTSTKARQQAHPGWRPGCSRHKRGLPQGLRLRRAFGKNSHGQGKVAPLKNAIGTMTAATAEVLPGSDRSVDTSPFGRDSAPQFPPPRSCDGRTSIAGECRAKDLRPTSAALPEAAARSRILQTAAPADDSTGAGPESFRGTAPRPRTATFNGRIRREGGG